MSLRFGVVMLCVVALTCFATDAQALTITGADDTNGSIEVTPSGTSVQASVGSGDAGVFIQRMPVTKSVTGVVIGDFAKPDSCSGDVDVYVNAYSHDTGDFANYSQMTGGFSVNPVRLSTTPARLSFTFTSRLTLLKGRAYSFRLQAYGCSTILQTTWLHPGQVEGGSVRCSDVGRLVSGGRPLKSRMYHDVGTSDSVSGCVNTPTGFGPDMPGGWLLTTSYNGYDRYVRTSRKYPPPAPPSDFCSENALITTGVEEVFWRHAPDYQGAEDYVCRFTQFTAPEVTTELGWLYAFPWPAQVNGSARDQYVKIVADDYSSLVEQYAPVLQYDSFEPYPAEPADPMPRYAAGTCGSATGSEWRNSLWSTTDTAVPLASADQCGGLPVLDSSWLLPEGATYPPSVSRSATVQSDDHLDEADDNYQVASNDIYTAAAAQQGTGDTVYGRAHQDAAGNLWLEYWFWYYYNNGENGFHVDYHEGDWEHVDLRLNSSRTPATATYGEHTYASVCPWNTVEQQNGRPVVYVAQGRHASWFANGTWGDYSDTVDGLGARVIPHVVVGDTNTPTFVRWPGRWGSTDASYLTGAKSPRGPAFHEPAWSDPSVEEASARTNNCPAGSMRSAGPRGRRTQRSLRRHPTVLRAPVVVARRNGSSIVVRADRLARSRPVTLLVGLRRQGSSVSRVRRLHVGARTRNVRIVFAHAPARSVLRVSARVERKGATSETAILSTR